jgi:cytidine deaminase
MTKIQKELLMKAKQATNSSYSPYSKFRVGAAVYANGKIFQGANIENASNPLGICAERVAIAHAIMCAATDIEGIAIYCIDAKKDSKDNFIEEQCLPCGACLQWISELAPNAWIVTNANKKTYEILELLPKPFKIK